MDSSALVKLYVHEIHSEQTRRHTLHYPHLICHGIGYVEVRAALASAERSRRLIQGDYARAVERFRADWEQISTLGIDEPLLERAAELAEGFALRGYDSIHLAAADRVFKGVRRFAFLAFDTRLNQAAKLLGMALPSFAQE